VPLTTPPQVKIGDLPWTSTEWVPLYPLEQVQRGEPSLPLDGAEFLHWTVYLGVGSDTDPAQVCRLFAAGPDAPPAEAGDPARLVLAGGTYPTRLRIRSGPEWIVRDGDTLTVG